MITYYIYVHNHRAHADCQIPPTLEEIDSVLATCVLFLWQQLDLNDIEAFWLYEAFFEQIHRSLNPIIYAHLNSDLMKMPLSILYPLNFFI